MGEWRNTIRWGAISANSITRPWAVVMQLDLPAGAGAGGAADVGGSDADGHQLAVSAVRPLVLWEPLPSVRVMALMPSAAALPRPVGLLAAWIVAADGTGIAGGGAVPAGPLVSVGGDEGGGLGG